MKQRHICKLRHCEREFKSQHGNPLFWASTSPAVAHIRSSDGVQNMVCGVISHIMGSGHFNIIYVLPTQCICFRLQNKQQLFHYTPLTGFTAEMDYCVVRAESV